MGWLGDYFEAKSIEVDMTPTRPMLTCANCLHWRRYSSDRGTCWEATREGRRGFVSTDARMPACQKFEDQLDAVSREALQRAPLVVDEGR